MHLESSPLHPQPDVHTHTHTATANIPISYPHGLSHRPLSYYTPHTCLNTLPNILHIVSTNTLFTPPLPTHPTHTTSISLPATRTHQKRTLVPHGQKPVHTYTSISITKPKLTPAHRRRQSARRNGRKSKRQRPPQRRPTRHQEVRQEVSPPFLPPPERMIPNPIVLPLTPFFQRRPCVAESRVDSCRSYSRVRHTPKMEGMVG